MRRTLEIVAVFSLAFMVAPMTHAQTVEAKATLTLFPPTLSTTNTPLTGADAITKTQVWVSTSPIADTDASPTAVLPGVATSYVWTGTVPNGSPIYARYSVCNAACSGKSPQVSRAIQVAVPAVPQGAAITVTVTLSIQ
jgi:hypothetical protein